MRAERGERKVETDDANGKAEEHDLVEWEPQPGQYYALLVERFGFVVAMGGGW